MWMKVDSLSKKSPPIIVVEKGKREMVSLTSAERGENFTVSACCNAAGTYILPLVIFKSVHQKPICKIISSRVYRTHE